MCPKACHVRLNEPIDAAYAQDGQPRSICDGSGGMRRVFADEFDNATLDEATWEVVEGWSAQTNSMTRSGWGDKAEAYLDGAGHLVLRTRRATPQEWAMHAGQPGWKGYYTGAASLCWPRPTLRLGPAAWRLVRGGTSRGPQRRAVAGDLADAHSRQRL